MNRIYPFRVFINYTTHISKHPYHGVKFHKEIFVSVDQAVARYCELYADNTLTYWSLAITITHPDLNPDQAWDYIDQAFKSWNVRKHQT